MISMIWDVISWVVPVTSADAVAKIPVVGWHTKHVTRAARQDSTCRVLTSTHSQAVRSWDPHDMDCLYRLSILSLSILSILSLYSILYMIYEYLWHPYHVYIYIHIYIIIYIYILTLWTIVYILPSYRLTSMTTSTWRQVEPAIPWCRWRAAGRGWERWLC